MRIHLRQVHEKENDLHQNQHQMHPHLWCATVVKLPECEHVQKMI